MTLLSFSPFEMFWLDHVNMKQKHVIFNEFIFVLFWKCTNNKIEPEVLPF